MTLFKVYSFYTGEHLVEAVTKHEAINRVKKLYFDAQNKKDYPYSKEFAKIVIGLPEERFNVSEAVVIK